MIKYRRAGILIGSICFYHLTYAWHSQLIIDNNVPDIKISITTDLVCSVNTRYTVPLNENPILYNQGQVKASWKNCIIMPAEYFRITKTTDHSKIYVNLLDTKSGDQFIATITTARGFSSREIHFSNNHILLEIEEATSHGFEGSNIKLSFEPLKQNS